jgi:multiple sugar transport system substrate-binding protein
MKETTSGVLRRLPVLLVSCAAWLLLLSCGGKEDGAQGTKVTITFWHSCVSSTVPALNDLLARFEAEHPGISVKAQYIPTGDALIQKLVTAVQSKTAPDISWIHANFVQDLVEADAIYPMDQFIHGPDSLSAADVADIYAPLLKDAKWRGTQYTMPMEATGIALLYNPQLFKNVGLDPEKPPSNWEEFHQMAKRLTVDRNGDGKMDQVGFFVPIFPASGPLGDWMVWQWYPYLFQAGGTNVNDEQTEVLFNSEPGVRALTLWKDIYRDLNLSSFTIDYEVAFASKQLAMTLDGPWNIPRWKKIKGLEWRIAPLPAGPAKRATIVGGEFLAIFKQSLHPKEAWTFVKWIVRPDIQAFWSMKSGYLPIRHSVSREPAYAEFLKSEPQLKAYVDQLEVAQAPGAIDYSSLRISRNLAEAIEKATLGGQDPRTVLDEAAMKSNVLLQAGAKKKGQQ